MIERIFKSHQLRGVYPDTFGQEDAWKVGYATALYFQRSRTGLAVARVERENAMVVGRDLRPHSAVLAAAVIEGIRAGGVDVIDVGEVDTPFVHFAVNQLSCVGGIQVTGSHLPPQYNGMMIFGPQARPIGGASGLNDIRRIADTLRVGRTGLQGELEQPDLWPQYRPHVLKDVTLSRKLRVVVDASHGVAGKMIPAVFGDLEGLEIVPLRFDPVKVAHESDPLAEGHLSALASLVVESQADLGVCFDGDADACVFVDHQGAVVRPDWITALIGCDLVARRAGATILVDVRSSRAVLEAISTAGGKVQRERAGHALIRRGMADTSAAFAGEATGHYYFEGNFSADSGAMALGRVLQILAASGGTLADRIHPYQRYAHSGEISFAAGDAKARFRDIADQYRRGKIDYLDGITVDFDDWWFNLRKSNNEPLLRLNVESLDAQSLKMKVEELQAILGAPVGTQIANGG